MKQALLCVAAIKLSSHYQCSNHKTEQPLPSMEHKMAYMIVLFCFLIHMTVIGSDNEFFHTPHRTGAITMLLGQAAWLPFLSSAWVAS